MNRLAARVVRLLFTPSRAWAAIEAERAGPRQVLLAWVAPLSLLPAAAVAARMVVLHAPTSSVLLGAAFGFAMGMLGALATAEVVRRAAPAFGAAPEGGRAMQVAGHGLTPVYLSSLFVAWPGFGLLMLLGAPLALRLLYLGAPKVMKPAAGSGANFAVASVAGVLGLSFVSGLALVLLSIGPAAPLRVLVSGEDRLPSATPSGNAVSRLSEEALLSLAPESLEGMTRVGVRVESVESSGVSAIALDARYERGGRGVGLKIVHSGSLDDVIGFGGAATTEYDRTDGGSFQRRRRDGSAIVMENWDDAASAGSFGRVMNGEFYVVAHGFGGVPLEQLKRVVMRYSDRQLLELKNAE